MTVVGATSALRTALAASLAGRLGADCNVWLASDAALRRLNRRYRKKDAVADVLSFAQGGGLPGDVAISLPSAVRKARKSGLSVADEVLTLAVHGLLHLRGLDHATDRGYALMRRAEESLLAPHRLRSGLERAAEEVE